MPITDNIQFALSQYPLQQLGSRVFVTVADNTPEKKEDPRLFIKNTNSNINENIISINSFKSYRSNYNNEGFSVNDQKFAFSFTLNNSPGLKVFPSVETNDLPGNKIMVSCNVVSSQSKRVIASVNIAGGIQSTASRPSYLRNKFFPSVETNDLPGNEIMVQCNTNLFLGKNIPPRFLRPIQVEINDKTKIKNISRVLPSSRYLTYGRIITTDDTQKTSIGTSFITGQYTGPGSNLTQGNIDSWS
jgi:hypothetical protein